MKDQRPRRGRLSALRGRPLLLLGVAVLSVGVTFGRGAPEASAISPSTLSVTPVSGTYGGTTNLSAQLTSSGTPVAGEAVDLHIGATDLGAVATDASGNASINNVSLTGLNAGMYVGDITASFAGDASFAPSSGAADLNVTPAPLTITADSQVNVYGAALPTLTASYTGFVNGDAPASLTTPPTLTTTATAASHVAGSPYAITASGAVDSNYAISYVAGSLTVLPAWLTITADDQTKVYGAALPTLTASFTGFVNGDTPASLTTPPTITTTATAASHVAAYAITASGAGDSDYVMFYSGGSLSVTPAPLTIFADYQTKVYGGALPTLTASFIGLVNGDTPASLTTPPTITTTATAASHVAGNPYAINPSGAVDSDYTISYVSGSLTVSPALLTITPDNQSKVYGAALPILTASFTGLVNGDTSASLATPPTITTMATAASHVAGNPYTITASGAVDSDYLIGYIPGILVVTPAPLTITPDNQSKVYGAALPTLTASYTGFVNGDTSTNLTTQPTLGTAATGSSHVAGSPYSITASGAIDLDYAISYVGGSLTITAAPLTITANNQTKVYGYPLPTLTAGYTGFVNGDTSANLTTQPSISTTATANSSVAGSPYLITASGATDPDYTIAYVNGTLTVTAAPIIPPIPTTTVYYPVATSTPVATNSPAPTSTSVPTSTPVVQASPTSSPASPTASVTPTDPTVAPRPTTASLQFKGGRFILNVDAGTITPGQALTLKAVATGNPATSPTFGTVTYKDGLTVLGTSKLVGGTAVLHTTKLGSGVHDLTATLNGKKGGVIGITPPVYVVVETKGVVIPVLVLHNLSRTVLGGRALPCEVTHNSDSQVQQGCEMVTSDWLAGAKVTYTMTLPNEKTLVFTNEADGHGHSKALFNLAYRPAAVKKGLAREMVLITVQAVLPNGTTAGRTFIRFAVQR